MYGLCGYPLWRCANVHMQALGCVYARLGFGCVFQVDGDEDEPEVGKEGLVDPVWRVAALRWCFMRLKTRSTMFRPLCASLSQSHGAVRFLLGGTTGVRPNDSAGGQVGSPSCARSMGGRAPMNAPDAAI